MMIAATVTQASPLRVEVDGAGSDSLASVLAFAAQTFTVDDRVWTVAERGRVFVAARLDPAADAHDASSVSFTPAGSIAATDVQAAIEEVAAEAGGVTARAAQVRRTAVQSIANNTTVNVQWDAEVSDVDGFHDNVTNNTRLTVPSGVAGPAVVEFRGKFAAHATGRRDYFVYKNGSFIAGQRYGVSAGAVIHYGTIVIVDPAVVAGDYFESAVVQVSGAALDFGGSAIGDSAFAITVFDS